MTAQQCGYLQTWLSEMCSSSNLMMWHHWLLVLLLYLTNLFSYTQACSNLMIKAITSTTYHLIPKLEECRWPPPMLCLSKHTALHSLVSKAPLRLTATSLSFAPLFHLSDQTFISLHLPRPRHSRHDPQEFSLALPPSLFLSNTLSFVLSILLRIPSF